MFKNMFLLAVAAISFFAAPVMAGPVTVLSWNVERGWKPDASIDYISQKLAGYDSVHNPDIYVLTEADADMGPKVERAACAAGGICKSVVGTTSDDRIMIIYDASRFEVIDTHELTQLQMGFGGRAPLRVIFRDRSDDAVFGIVGVHLHRKDSLKRFRQSQLLGSVAEGAATPTIFTGDFNYDFDIQTQDHDAGMDAILKSGDLKWVAPRTLVKTQCAKRYNSVLDFFFTTVRLPVHRASSTILEEHASYCAHDDAHKPDHRPILMNAVVR